MPYLQASSGIRNTNNQPVIFAITTDHRFLVTLPDKSVDAGWSQWETPNPAGKDYLAQAFVASQNMAGEIWLSLAVGKTEAGPSRLFVAGPLSSDPTKTNFHSLTPSWTERVGEDQQLVITHIEMGTDDDGQGEPLIIVRTTQLDRKLPKHYQVCPETDEEPVRRFPSFDDVDRLYDLKIGTLPQARGVYMLYSSGNARVLEFDGVPDPQYDVSFHVTLDAPPGAMGLESKINRDGYTDLHVIGEGEFLFTSDNQASGGKAKKIADSVNQAKVKITSRSALTHEYRPVAKPVGANKLEPYPTYRTSISLPPDVAAVDIWASEEVELQAQGKKYLIDAVKPVRLQPNAMAKLVVNLPAKGLSCPTLRIQTNTMPSYDWFFICPDVDVHQKIAGLEDGALYDARKKLGISEKFTKEDCGQVQQTMRSMTQSIQYTYNPTLHGTHHDRGVLPKNMDDAHFMLDFSPEQGNVRYQALRKSDVRKLIQGATLVGADTTQGLFEDLGKAFQEAGSIIVHTAEHLIEDVIDTGEHGVEDVVDSISKFGEDLVHGDILEAGKDLLQGGENLGSDLLRGAGNLAGDLVKGAGQLLVVTLKYAGKAMQYVLTHTGLVGQFLSWIFKKIGAAMENVLDWLLDAIGWDEVLHTHDVLVESFNNGIAALKRYPEKLKAGADDYFQSLEKTISDDIDKAINKIDPQPLRRPSTVPDGYSGAIEKLDWLMSMVCDNGPQANPIPQLALDAAAAEPIQLFIQELEKQLGKDGGKVFETFKESFDYVGKIFSDPSKAPEHFLSAVLEFAKGMALAGLEIINALFDTLMDLVEFLLDAFKKAMNANLHIPFLADLYETITQGRELTPLSLAALLIALPTTIVHNLMFKAPPFKGAGALTLSSDDVGANESKALDPIDTDVRAWGTVYGISHIVLFPLSVAQNAKDLLDYAGDIFPDKEKEAEVSPLSTTLTYLDLGAGFMAQLAGCPIGKPDFNNPDIWNKDDAIRSPNYWAHVVWDYQWFGWLIALVTSGAVTITEAQNVKQTKLSIAQDIVSGVTTLWGIVHVVLIAVLDVADRKKTDRLSSFGSYHWDLPPREFLFEVQKEGLTEDKLQLLNTDLDRKSDEELATEVRALRNYLNWVTQGGIPRKGFGNVMDTFPEIGQLGAAPDLVEATDGISILVTALINSLGHLGEGITYLDRTERNGIL